MLSVSPMSSPLLGWIGWMHSTSAVHVVQGHPSTLLSINCMLAFLSDQLLVAVVATPPPPPPAGHHKLRFFFTRDVFVVATADRFTASGRKRSTCFCRHQQFRPLCASVISGFQSSCLLDRIVKTTKCLLLVAFRATTHGFSPVLGCFCGQNVKHSHAQPPRSIIYLPRRPREGYWRTSIPRNLEQFRASGTVISRELADDFAVM